MKHWVAKNCCRMHHKHKNMNISNHLFGLLVLLLLTGCVEDPILKVTNITLSEPTVTLSEGDSLQLEVIFEPKGAKTNLMWTSSNEKVATVNQQGVVRALSRGFTMIKAKSDSLYATSDVNVTRVDLPYRLVWSDEFNGTSLDASVWNIETGGGGWGNRESQFYTGRPENLRVENGHLIIQARREPFQTNNYTSARINTRDKKSFQYGRIEARISLPSGQGIWPAFWMLGANFAIARWPLCGEIDIMEHAGSEPNTIVHAVHTGERNGSRGNNWFFKRNVPNVQHNFNVYSIEWEERASEGNDNIGFFINGVRSTTLWEPHVNATVQNWPFKQEFFLILNLALGGTMGGTINDAIFNNDVIMKVDYVRVYQRK